MNKTFSINISGLIFNIEEEAYQVLSTYLESLKKYLGNSIGKEEILADIEARIAELFTQKITDRKQVITQPEVEEIIAILGQPEEFMLDDADLGNGENTQQADMDELKGEKLKKRVFRNPDDKIGGGVLSGLAAYFDHDPLWWRLVFVVFVFLGWGSPIFVYLILWIIIPEATTRAERLQMRGEPITVENLKRTVEEETEHLKRKAADLSHGSAGAKIKNAVQEIVQFFINALGIIFKAIGKVIGVAFLFFGVVLTFTLITMWFADTHELIFNDGLLTPGQSFNDLAQFITTSETDADLIMYGGFLTLLTMSLGAIFSGLKILSAKVKNLTKFNIGLILLSLWFVGVVMLCIGGGRTLKDFSKTEQIVNTEPLTLQGDTLTLALNDNERRFSVRFADNGHRHGRTKEILDIKNNIVYCGDVDLDIQQIDANRPAEIKVVRYSEGGTALDALKRAQNVTYNWKADSTGTLRFDSYIAFPTADKYRNQQVDITLYLPVGKSIYLSPGSDKIFYNLKNTTHTWDREMVGHTWTMTKDGLHCPDAVKEGDQW